MFNNFNAFNFSNSQILVEEMCTKCKNFPQTKNKMCNSCYEIETCSIYNKNTFDNIINNPKLKQKYFELHINSFWNEFCKHVNIKHSIFTAEFLAKTIINNAITPIP
jgi:hypothetical protein